MIFGVLATRRQEAGDVAEMMVSIVSWAARLNPYARESIIVRRVSRSPAFEEAGDSGTDGILAP